MYLRESTKKELEKSIGKTVKELSEMDFDEEIQFIQKKTGRTPIFSRLKDHRMTARGNHNLVERNFMTMDEVDEQIVSWSKCKA